MLNFLVCCFFIFYSWVYCVYGHGRMEDPPARNSAWRHGFNTPVNYNDVELNCGFRHQSLVNYGKTCGVCGDPVSANPRPNEFGGKFATGRIVRTYQIGQIIDVHILLSANHLGWMQFRLCPIEKPNTEATHECLEQNILNVIGYGARVPVTMYERDVRVKVQLPSMVVCEHCVLQWRYRAGNSWGYENGKSGIGYGPQEEFINCADVSIFGSRTNTTLATTHTTITPTITPTVTTTITTADTNSTVNTNNITNATTDFINTSTLKSDVPISITYSLKTASLAPTTITDKNQVTKIVCFVAVAWKKFHGMEEFCLKTCKNMLHQCPTKYCKCHEVNE